MKKGFTLIETVLVVATFALIFVISVPLYQSFQVRNYLYVTIDNITQSLQRAQTRAVYMERDSAWGVKIVTNSAKFENVTVFKGNDFASRDTEYDEIFYGSSSIEVTGATELVFNKFTGELSVASGSITITAPQIGLIQKRIDINKKGTITVITIAPPTVVTVAASAIISTTATLNGTGNPNGLSTTGWFRYDATNPGTCDDTFGIRVPASSGTDLGSGTSAVAFDKPVTGLTSGTTYYFCAIASNSQSISAGSVLSFTTTPMGHWALNETSGTTAADSSGNGNTGTLVNGPIWTTGKYANGLSFDGVDDYVSLPDIGLSTAWTMSAWVKRTAGAGQKTIMDFNNDTSVCYLRAGEGSDNGASLSCSGSLAITQGGNISNGAWHHVVGVRDGGTAYLYVDGLQVGSDFSFTTSSFTSTNSRIGREFWQGNNYFTWDGSIDDVRVYNRALSASEVSELYNQ